MSTDRLSTGETNPRGIPQAAFLKKVEDYLNPKTCTEDDVNNFLKELQTRMQQYRFMESSKESTLASLNEKIPDVEKSLEMCKFLKEKHESSEAEDDEEAVQAFDYQLNDTVYSEATVKCKDMGSVRLWLGANVMVEYPVDEAIEMLQERLDKSKKSKADTLEDLDYLRANITTMEVNTARVYNWDVARRRAQKKEETK